MANMAAPSSMPARRLCFSARGARKGVSTPKKERMVRVVEMVFKVHAQTAGKDHQEGVDHARVDIHDGAHDGQQDGLHFQ